MWDYAAVAAVSFLCGWVGMLRFIHVSQRNSFMHTRTQAARAFYGWRTSVPRSWGQTIARSIQEPMQYALLSEADVEESMRELEDHLRRHPIEEPGHPQSPETVAIVAEIVQDNR